MNIYWNIQDNKLHQGPSNSVFSSLSWVLRDQYDINIYIMQPDATTGAYTVQEAPSGWFPKAAIKYYDAAGLTGNNLVYAGTWTKNGTGENAYYNGTLNLNTTELIDDISADTSKTYKLEFTLQNASLENRNSTQINVKIAADIIRPTSDAPITLAEMNPVIEEFIHQGKKCQHFKNTDGEILFTACPKGVTYP